jgi:hypothetical protein
MTKLPDALVSRKRELILCALLPPLALAVLLFVFQSYNIELSLSLDLVVMFWGSVAPGILIVMIFSSVFSARLSWLQVFALGAALGLGVLPASYNLMRTFGGGREVLLVISFLNFSLVVVLNVLEGRHQWPNFPHSIRSLWIVAWASLLVVGCFLGWYNFANLHFDTQGNLLTHALSGIDPPYLIAEIASLKNFGHLHDIHQYATPFFYHDYVYIFSASIARVTHSELLSIGFFALPVFSYTILTISVFAFIFSVNENRLVAAAAALSWLLLGSFVGTEQGASALSPSYVWGNILFINILNLLHHVFQSREDSSENRLPILAAFQLIGLLLVILMKTKITTFLAIEATLPLLLLWALLKRDWKTSIGIAVPWLFTLVMFFTVAANKNPFMPSGDFIIGGPLLGYANHLASYLHVTPSSVSPIVKGLEFAPRQLLILPYFAFHLLRFVVADPRLLLVLLGVLLLRKRLPVAIFPNAKPIFFWFLAYMIAICFFFPVLYSPAWYPLAFSFYTPMLAIIVAGLLAVLFVSYLLRSSTSNKEKIGAALAVLLLVGGVFGNTRAIISEDRSTTDTVQSSRINALRYLRTHSDFYDVVATRRYDLDLKDTINDESYFDYSAFSERTVISEGARYGVLLGATADIDTLKGLHRVKIAIDTLSARRQRLDSIYLSTNPTTVLADLKEYNAKYIIEDKEIAQKLAIDPHSIAEPFFDNPSMTIWQVRY